MSYFTAGFADEMTKMARFPISRMVTAPFKALRGGGLAKRVAGGGRGMTHHEKKQIASSLGISQMKLEHTLARMAKKKGRARSMRGPVPGVGHLTRAVGARGIASRAARGGKGMSPKELAVMKELLRESRKVGRGKRVLGGLATVGGLGLGAGTIAAGT